MSTTTTSDTPQRITSGSSLFARGAIINGRRPERWDLDASTLTTPLHWRNPRHAQVGDLFHREVPFEFIDRVFAVMALCPQHAFQVLTKRPERMAEYLAGRYDGCPRWACVAYAADEECTTVDGRRLSDVYVTPESWPLPNVWLGTSVENQAAADERIPHLLRCPAAVRFLSVEPLLGPVALDAAKRKYGGTDFAGVQWVIVGGESGAGARPCSVGWIRSIVGQCKAAGVPCFVKQLGAKPYSNADKIGHRGMDYKALMPERKTVPVFWRFLNDPKGGDMAEWPDDLRVREFPEARP